MATHRVTMGSSPFVRYSIGRFLFYISQHHLLCLSMLITMMLPMPINAYGYHD